MPPRKPKVERRSEPRVEVHAAAAVVVPFATMFGDVRYDWLNDDGSGLRNTETGQEIRAATHDQACATVRSQIAARLEHGE